MIDVVSLWMNRFSDSFHSDGEVGLHSRGQSSSKLTGHGEQSEPKQTFASAPFNLFRHVSGHFLITSLLLKVRAVEFKDADEAPRKITPIYFKNNGKNEEEEEEALQRKTWRGFDRLEGDLLTSGSCPLSL